MLRLVMGTVGNAEAIGVRVKALRDEHGWSQERLARETGGAVTTSTVGRVERGLHKPHLDTLDALAEALGVTASSLLGGAA